MMLASPTRACIHCHKTSTEDSLELCSDCQVAFCCSTLCFNPVDVEQDPQAHLKWCSQMSLYKSFPKTTPSFAFFSETSSASFDQNNYRQFLQMHNLLGRGAWRREVCPTNTLLPEFGELASINNMDELIALPMEAEILRDGTIEPPENDITSWSEYYQWRGFPETSPICILLQFPLTLYHVIRHCLPVYHPDVSSQILEKKLISVHVLGVEKEADLLPLFNELAILLPHVEFHLHFFGPGLSKKAHGKVYKYRSMKIILRRKVYHKSTLATNIPDLVIGFNAGLAAYPSWQPTIECLQTSSTPVFFTDYCRLSVDLSRQCLQSSHLGSLSEVSFNPFHSPIREFNPEHLMPCYSNAFIFQLIK